MSGKINTGKDGWELYVFHGKLMKYVGRSHSSSTVNFIMQLNVQVTIADAAFYPKGCFMQHLVKIWNPKCPTLREYKVQ